MNSPVVVGNANTASNYFQHYRGVNKGINIEIN